jgi:hypothetical protein
MNENRRRVLDMLAEGKIGAEEAERLLLHVDPPPGSLLVDNGGSRVPRGGPPRYLHVIVNEPGERVNIRVPLGLIRAGMKLTSLIPTQATNGISEALKEKGVDMDLRDLAGEGLDELLEALGDLEVQVQSENEQVHIYVE